MDTIYESLRKDHDIQRDLMDKIASTNGDSQFRRSLFTLLKKELEEHAKYEERYFYVSLLNSDLTQEKARHSIAEHHEIDEKIEKLEETDFSSTSWLTLFKSLKELVEHHLKEEEQEVFPLSGKALNTAEKNELAKKYQNNMLDSFESGAQA